MENNESVSEVSYAPKTVSFAKNAQVTAILFAVFGVLGAALWGIEQLTAGK